MTTSPRTGRYRSQRYFDYGRLVSLFDSYMFTDSVDPSMSPRMRGEQQPESPEFFALLASWLQDMVQRELAPTTQRYFGGLSRDYLNFLEAEGIRSWDGADGSSILGFLETLRNRRVETDMWSAAASFRPFLKFTARTDLLDALALARTRRNHEIVPMLDFGVEQEVLDACRQGPVSSRDAAITLRPLCSGLRACDILGLRLADIDWRRHHRDRAAKDRQPLTLPLPPLAPAKLARYVLDERPASEEDEVFSRLKAPHVAFADHAAIYVIVNKVFRVSGVEDMKVGTRVFRYNAASKLLQADTALPTISAILGHAHSDWTNVYLHPNDRNLASAAEQADAFLSRDARPNASGRPRQSTGRGL